VSEKNINRIVESMGRDGLRFVFVFKIIKDHVQKELTQEGKPQPAESVLNRICADASKEILISSESTPSEKQINEAIINVKKRLKKPLTPDS